MSEHKEIEEGDRLMLDFGKLAKVAATGHTVVPVVVQCVDTEQVLIVAYANQEALEESFRRKVAVFWSTSRNELWIKGASSGDYLDLQEVRVNCEQNSLLYRVRRRGKGSCHTHRGNGDPRSGCYYRRLNPDGTLKNLEP
jgi:phosphoribosyl-AMP cyclohydrolase